MNGFNWICWCKSWCVKLNYFPYPAIITKTLAFFWGIPVSPEFPLGLTLSSLVVIIHPRRKRISKGIEHMPHKRFDDGGYLRWLRPCTTWLSQVNKNRYQHVSIMIMFPAASGRTMLARMFFKKTTVTKCLKSDDYTKQVWNCMHICIVSSLCKEKQNKTQKNHFIWET